MYNITKPQYVQLLLIPILISIILYSFLDSKDTPKGDTMKIIKHGYIKSTNKEFYLYFQNIMMPYKLKIVHEKFDGNVFRFTFVSKYNEGFRFIDKLSQSIKIKELLIRFENDYYIFKVVTPLKIFKNRNSSEKIISPVNLFEKEKKESNAIAIIDNNIFYKNKWLHMGDTIDDGVISKIGLNGFYIIKNKKEVYVELFNNEK